MSYKRKLKRGYNQSELLAKELGRKLEIKVIKTLEKSKNTKVQSTLKEEEREDNVKNAFSFLENIEIRNKNIVLVDDILTTGSTVNSASRILKQNGANKICVFTISKTRLNKLEY